MIYEIHSERQRAKTATDDVYQYDEVPQKLRVQIQQILRDAIGPHYLIGPYATHAPDHNDETWKFIHKTLCREFGVHSLGNAVTAGQETIDFLAVCSSEQFVDAVELCVRAIDRVLRDWSDHKRNSSGIEQLPEEALQEINHRFRKSGFGFQFVDGVAIRVDSEFAHEEMVKPALLILCQTGFEGARDEYMSAHRHYRNGDYEEAITEAAKAFESTLKVTCDRNGWAYSPGARASDLLKKIRAEGLWPQYLDSSFDQLLATLTSGLPKVRNEHGAHGQGGTVRSTPAFVAGYALHLAAAKIIFIAEAAETRVKESSLVTP